MTEGDYSEPDDINDALLGLIEDLSDEFGITVDQAIKNVERQYSLDLAGIPDDDAEEFVDAFENGDASKIEDVLIDQGVPEDQARQFREMAANEQAEADPATGDGDARGNGESPSETSSGGGNVDEQQVRQIVHDEVQNAVRQAVSSQQAAQQQQGGGGGIDPQQQMVLQLASQFLGGGGGGQAAKLGEQVQNEAMQAFIKDLRKPDLGDMLEMKYYEEALGSDVVENMMGEWMPDAADDEDENSVMGMFPMDDSDSEDDDE